MKKTLKNIATLAFVQGVLATMLLQDLLGQERVVEMAKTHWVDSHISGPLEIVAIVFIFVRLSKLIDPKTND